MPSWQQRHASVWEGPGAAVADQFGIDEFDPPEVGRGQGVSSGIIGLGIRLSAAGWADPETLLTFRELNDLVTCVGPGLSC
jgi:hypothetical protein